MRSIRPSASDQHELRITSGILFMVAGVMLVPILDAIAKYLAAALTPGQIALFRFGIQSVILMSLLTARGQLAWPGAQAGWLALAGVFVAGAVGSLNWAVAELPLATAISIFFVEPLFLTLIAALVLGEKIGPRRIGAIAAGLAGALIVIRPNWGSFGPAILLPISAAIFFACYVTTVRGLSSRLGGLHMQAWSGTMAAIVLVGANVFGTWAEVPIFTFAPVPGWAWPYLLASGAIAALAHMMLAMAFRRVEAGALAPFQYLEIIGATMLGYFIFSDFPDALTWVGTAVILSAGLYVFYRERQSARGVTASTKRPAR
jgi:drug/metabolite transporter (DMT)-like permease